MVSSRIISILVGASLFCSLAVATTYPYIEGLLDEARTLRLSGRFEDADVKLFRALRIAPKSADVYLEYAYLRKDQGNYDDLKDLVDVGSTVADGPPSSLAQLKLLQKNLSALSLPIAPSDTFSTPPAIAQQPVKPQSAGRSDVVSPTVKMEATVASADNAKKDQGVGGEKIDKEQISVGGSAGSGGRDVPIAVTSRQVEFPEASNVAQPKAPLVSGTVRAESVDAGKVRVDTVGNTDQKKLSIDTSSEVVVAREAGVKDKKQKTGLVEQDSGVKPETGGRDYSDPIVPKSSNLNSNESGQLPAVDKGYKRSKTAFVGLGILGKTQSGTFMNRWPIENDY